jgi:hypothetical protein
MYDWNFAVIKCMQTITVYDGIFKDLSTITMKKPLFAKILEFLFKIFIL